MSTNRQFDRGLAPHDLDMDRSTRPGKWKRRGAMPAVPPRELPFVLRVAQAARAIRLAETDAERAAAEKEFAKLEAAADELGLFK